MYVLILFTIKMAVADIGPPPTCPEGKYRIYHYGHRCIRNGYSLVAVKRYNLSREDIQKIKDGEITIPDVNMKDVKIGYSSFEVKQEDIAKVQEFLKYFHNTEEEKQALKRMEKRRLEREEKRRKEKKEKEQLERLEYSEPANEEPKKEEAKKEVILKEETTACSQTSLSHRLSLLIGTILIAMVRRRS